MSQTVKLLNRTSAGRRVYRAGHWLKERWERAQVRLGSMVLSDVPLVLIATVVVLTAFGIVMVLSASSVEQISAGLLPYAQARSQAMFAVLGFIAMLIIGFLVPVRFYRQPWVLYTALLVCVLLLLAVIALGEEIGGNRNWIRLGGFSLQPSEVAKPVMILWLAMIFSRQGQIDRGTFAQTLYKALIPAALGFLLIVGLILAGHDLGTVLVYGIFFSVMLLAAKPAKSTVWLALGGIGVAALGFVLVSPNRVERILNTFAFWKDCVEATCDQANSGLAALATGGFWGVGLGQSRQKYNYLPEAHNDYIFAIIGEELGLLGGISVLVLYAALIYCAMRILLRSSDIFIRFATIGIITWLAGQAMMNIAMVVGLMPVIGVPLPFVSSGGSALVSSLIGVGFLIGFARQTPLQPIVGQSISSSGNSTVQKDAARRVKLGRIVAAEQESIAADPYRAGWTLEKFKGRFWPSVPPVGSSPREANDPVRSAPATRRPAPSVPVSEPATAHPASKGERSTHRALTPVPAEAQRTEARPAERHEAEPAQATDRQAQPQSVRAAPAPPEVAPTPEQKAPEQKKPESKLPAGLRTIRKARQVPPRRTDES